ncbi:MAG TPA: EF-hand domain-containing protein [Burkholderiales bacterium]|nr:EF-hand domain-containing protein [Burkholderiales bacterium]
MRAALAVVLIAFASPLAAQSDNAAARALFQRLDTNRDGSLSRAELAAPAAKDHNWIAVDRNGDGRISPDEFGTLRSVAARPAPGAAGATARQERGQTPFSNREPR